MRYFKIYIVIYFILLFPKIGFSQRISLGAIAGAPFWHNTRLPDNYFTPEYSYFIYYTANKKDKPVSNQYFNGFSGGLTLSVDYKRYALHTDILGTFTTVKIDALFPSAFGELLDLQWSSLKVNVSAIRVPAYVTFKLTTKANGLYLIAGAQFSAEKYNEPRYGINTVKNISPGVLLSLAENELFGILYNTENKYASWISGCGYKVNNSSVQFRLHKRISREDSKLPLADYIQMDLMFAVNLTFQKLRKGHVIFTE